MVKLQTKANSYLEIKKSLKEVNESRKAINDWIKNLNKNLTYQIVSDIELLKLVYGVKN